MTTVTIQVAQATLRELIHALTPGEELVITENDRPVARLLPEPEPVAGGKGPRRAGPKKGIVLDMAPDFNTPLEEFNDYML